MNCLHVLSFYFYFFLLLGTLKGPQTFSLSHVMNLHNNQPILNSHMISDINLIFTAKTVHLVWVYIDVNDLHIKLYITHM